MKGEFTFMIMCCIIVKAKSVQNYKFTKVCNGRINVIRQLYVICTHLMPYRLALCKAFEAYEHNSYTNYKISWILFLFFFRNQFVQCLLKIFHYSFVCLNFQDRPNQKRLDSHMSSQIYFTYVLVLQITYTCNSVVINE